MYHFDGKINQALLPGNTLLQHPYRHEFFVIGALMPCQLGSLCDNRRQLIACGIEQSDAPFFAS
jgi:hypothetical protein